VGEEVSLGVGVFVGVLVGVSVGEEVSLGVGVFVGVLVGVTVGEGVGEFDGVGVFVAPIGGNDPSSIKDIDELNSRATV
jgi:hypothetical protein